MLLENSVDVEYLHGVRKFRRYDINSNFKLGKFFKVKEHVCKCKVCDWQFLHMELYPKLDIIRELIGKPFKINSGYRCQKHNSNVGGAPRSRHISGLAVDLQIVGATEQDYKESVRHAISIGFKGIGVYNNWVHLDLRKNVARW